MEFRRIKRTKEKLEGTYFANGDYSFHYRSENIQKKHFIMIGEKQYAVEIHKIEDMEIIFTYRFTDVMLFFNLEIKKIEEVEERIEEENVSMKIFELDTQVMDKEVFYSKGFEAVINFETKEEEGIGFLKEEYVYIPLREEEDLVVYVELSEEELIGINGITIESKEMPKGRLLYLGNNMDFANKNNKIQLTKDKSIEVNKEYDLIASKDDSYYIAKDNVINVIRRVEIEDTTIYTLDVVAETPTDVNVLYKRYISKKKTKGVTDRMVDCFDWLKY